MQQALLEHNAGRNRDAAALYQRVLADPLCPPDVWIKAANNLSVARHRAGPPQAALDLLEPARRAGPGAGPLLVAIITNSQAWSSFHAGEVVASLRLFEQAGRLYAAAGCPLGEHYLDYADVLVDLRLLDEARDGGPLGGGRIRVPRGPADGGAGPAAVRPAGAAARGPRGGRRRRRRRAGRVPPPAADRVDGAGDGRRGRGGRGRDRAPAG